MPPRAIVYFAASALMLLSVAKRAAYAGLLLLALPLDVVTVANNSGSTTVSEHFCGRNPHACASVGELYRELQLRSIAVQDIATSLMRHSIVARDTSSVTTLVKSHAIHVDGPKLVEPITRVR